MHKALLAVLLLSGSAHAGQKIYSISELKSAPPKSGRCWVEGYVAKVYVCPPCPEGKQCEPCDKPNVVLSATPKKLEAKDGASEADLIVYTPDAKSFVVGRKRRLKIKLPEGRKKGEPVKEAETL
jgi:hypothetical protein